MTRYYLTAEQISEIIVNHYKESSKERLFPLFTALQHGFCPTEIREQLVSLLKSNMPDDAKVDLQTCLNTHNDLIMTCLYSYLQRTPVYTIQQAADENRLTFLLEEQKRAWDERSHIHPTPDKIGSSVSVEPRKDNNVSESFTELKSRLEIIQEEEKEEDVEKVDKVEEVKKVESNNQKPTEKPSTKTWKYDERNSQILREHLTCRNSGDRIKMDIVGALVEKGAHPLVRRNNEDEWNIFQIAQYNGWEPDEWLMIIDCCKTAGLDNQAFTDGLSLYLSPSKHRTEMSINVIRQFVKNDADPWVKDSRGWTLPELAKRANWPKEGWDLIIEVQKIYSEIQEAQKADKLKIEQETKELRIKSLEQFDALLKDIEEQVHSTEDNTPKYLSIEYLPQSQHKLLLRLIDDLNMHRSNYINGVTNLEPTFRTYFPE